MKKILYFLIPFLCIGLVACSDDDSPVGGTAIRIESADLDFTAEGGEGSITVAGSGAISAVSDKDWCTVSVEGTVVHVTVAGSEEITSRSAVVTITSGSESLEVPVVQAGLVANIGGLSRFFGYAGGEFVIETNTTYSVTIPEEAQDWISYSEEVNSVGSKTKLVFNVGAASSMRGSEVKVQIGENEYSISVVQAEVADIIGTWNCSYLSGYAEDYMSGEITISNSDDGLMMREITFGYNLPVTFEDGQLAVPAGQIVSVYASIYYVATGTAASLSGAVSGFLRYVDGALTIELGNSSSFFALYAINPSTMQSVGWLEQYHNFTLSKQMQ